MSSFIEVNCDWVYILAPQVSGDLTGGTYPDVVNFIQKQEEYIEQLERESQYCRVSVCKEVNKYK